MLSLNWFKSKKTREIEDLKHEIKLRELKKELNRVDNPPAQPTPLWQTSTSWVPPTPVGIGGYGIVNSTPEKPYKTVKMVNDVITVVLNDGSILSKSGATADDFESVRIAADEFEIIDLMATQEVVAERKKQEHEAEKARALKAGIQILATLDDFEVKGDSVYLKGINRSLPQLLVEEFLRIVNQQKYYAGFGELQDRLDLNDEYQSLKRFFMWCCLNPRAEVADKLYNFLKKNSFKITKQGFFAALRNVVTLHGSTELVQFVSNAYNKVKAVWKKSPDNYHVILNNGEYRLIHEDDMVKTIVEECDLCEGEGEYRDFGTEDWEECGNCGTDGEYEVTVKNYEGEDLGRLTDLYLDLPNRAENRFTDAHTRTFDIRIGRAVNMDPAKCRWNTDDCGAEGLHFTSDEIHYVGCGDQSVLVLINPMKVVGIGESKGRCWEYLPIMTVPREEATSILHDLDFDTLQLDDSYAIRELENLTEKAKDGFVAESKKHEFNMPHISSAEIENIVASLDQMKSEISKRIVPLD